MPTNFPASNDTFNVPSTPVITPLGETGDSTRTHSENHRDLGDALMAMQVEATYKAHTHDGATFRHGNKLAQANTHESPDTDASTSSLHHTIGSGANQYASGTHTHAAVVTYPIGAFFFAWVSTYPGTPGLGLVGTWTAVGERFLCASGGTLGFPAGTTGGSNSHGHTISSSTNSVSGHEHELSSSETSESSQHTHTTSGTFSTSRTHFHGTDSAGVSTHAVDDGDGGSGSPVTAHGHTSFNSSPSHYHSVGTTGAHGNHSHVVNLEVNAGSSHSHTNSSPVSANNLVPLFVVYMWKRTA